MNNAARMFVFRPDSQGIADRLNEARAEVCEHHRAPCYLRCGVQRVTRGSRTVPQWEPIPLGLRLEWLLLLLEH
jgi:hypothetical protein